MTIKLRLLKKKIHSKKYFFHKMIKLFILNVVIKSYQKDSYLSGVY